MREDQGTGTKEGLKEENEEKELDEKWKGSEKERKNIRRAIQESGR